jgi:hypothetical protein
MTQTRWSLRTALLVTTRTMAAAAAPGLPPATASAGATSATAVPGGVACQSSPPSNRTVVPAASARLSLPRASPRPGPALLCRNAPRAPQLENTGVWRARPILVSGSSAHRSGQFLEQDYLYDEAPLSYRDQPNLYAGNATDLVELRVTPLAQSLAVRLTYNTLLDPMVVATAIDVGSSRESRAMTHDAGARMPAHQFVTAHVCRAGAVSAATGHRVPVKVGVRVDPGCGQDAVRWLRP